MEKMQQNAGNFEARSSRLKSATGRAVAQAKMEVMSHSNLVRQHMQLSQQIEQNPIPKLITEYEKLKDKSKNPND